MIIGREMVQVWPEVVDQDEEGNPFRRAAVTAVTVPCTVQPTSSVESSASGQEVTSLFRVFARSWPGGAFAKVTWAGRDFDVIGEPLRHGGVGAAHVVVQIRARVPETVAS